MSEAITLSNGVVERKFFFNSSFSYIRIISIQVIKDGGIKSGEIISTLNALTLFFTYTDVSGGITSFPIGLSSQIGPNHTEPIILFRNFEIPEENIGNMTSVGCYVKELMIKLVNKNNKEISVVINYEKTPGVELSE